MEIHDSNRKGWRSVLDFRRELSEPRSLKERGLIGTILVAIFVLTPAWIALVGWLFLRLALWLIGA
jgi:hypothetical protein